MPEGAVGPPSGTPTTSRQKYMYPGHGMESSSSQKYVSYLGARCTNLQVGQDKASVQ